MDEAAAIKAMIRAAFAGVEYPGDWCLRGSSEGEEPLLLEREFKGKTDWGSLDADFLDKAPAGHGSALSFFSDEALRFYLPAYLVADLDGRLERQDPVFHLTHGLTNGAQRERVNPRRYGERTWFEASAYRFSVFNPEQCKAIVRYLRFKLETDQSGFDKSQIEEALRNYWEARAGKQ